MTAAYVFTPRNGDAYNERKARNLTCVSILWHQTSWASAGNSKKIWGALWKIYSSTPLISVCSVAREAPWKCVLWR